MTAVKVIVACASVLAFALVGLVACGTNAERTGHVSTPTFAPTTAPAALIVLDHPVPVTVTRTVRAAAPRLAPITVTRTVRVPAPVRTSATPRTTSRPAESGHPVTQAFSYANCDQARADGVAPLRKGQAGYSRKLDRDGDGTACE